MSARSFDDLIMVGRGLAASTGVQHRSMKCHLSSDHRLFRSVRLSCNGENDLLHASYIVIGTDSSENLSMIPVDQQIGEQDGCHKPVEDTSLRVLGVTCEIVEAK